MKRINIHCYENERYTDTILGVLTVIIEKELMKDNGILGDITTGNSENYA